MLQSKSLKTHEMTEYFLMVQSFNMFMVFNVWP